MKITTKLIATFSSVIALAGVMGLMGYRGLSSVAADLTEVAAVRAPSVQGLYMLKTGFYGVRAANAALMLDTLPADKRQVQQEFRNDCLKEIREGWAIYEPLPQTAEEAEVWADFLPHFKAWEQAAADVAASQLAWDKARDEGKPAEAIAAAHADVKTKFATVGTHFAAVREELKKLVEINVAIQSNIATHGTKQAHEAETVLLGAMGVMAVVASVLGVLICTNIKRSFTRLITRVAEVQSSNDLTLRVDDSSKDEIGQLGGAFNGMINTLQSIISEVSSATTQVATAATEIAASSEEMAAAVGEVARQSTSAAQKSEASGQLATEGGEIVQATVAGMREIEVAVSQSAESVTSLGKRGDEIGVVISVINDIADQTNLLALNAAIEAARAGEHGRGFAVVADEVRKLADRTTKATEEIGGSIKAIQNETTTAAERMSRGSEQVKSGVANSERAGSSLEQIVAGARDLASMIMSISAASEEAGAGASQSASAATELSAKSEQLRTLVERFKV